MTWLLGIAEALLLGIVTNMLHDFTKYGTARAPSIVKRRQRLSDAACSHDPEKDGLFTLVTWSCDRPLTPDSLVTGFEGRVRRSLQAFAVLT